VRILLVAQWYRPMIGGEERHVRDLGHELARTGHQVAVATLRHQGQPEVSDDDGVVVHRVAGTAQRLPVLFADSERRSAQPMSDPGVARALRRLVADWRPDVVHAHNWMVYSYLPVRRAGGPPLVLTLHDYSWICPKKDLVRWGSPCPGPELGTCLRCAATQYGAAKSVATVLAHRRSAAAERRGVDRLIAVSRAVADGNRLSESGVPWDVIPNFVSPADSDSDAGPAAASLVAALPSEPFILFVGALSRRKGVAALLEAYADGDGLPPLVLIGYPTSDEIAGLDRPAGRVTVLRSWPPEAVQMAWARSVLGVVPSTWDEPSPSAALEAMLAGRPVVASRVGGLPDIVVDGQTGLLVPPGDAAALRTALRTLSRDEARRLRMGEEARRRVTGFTAARVVPRIEAVYRAAVGASSSSTS
jgi:glycosyltransferase involved in cell wall biosynthesis